MVAPRLHLDMVDHRQIEEQAAAWLARRDGEGWSASDESTLEAWLAEATAHRVAFLRLESAWEKARRLRALGVDWPKRALSNAPALQPSSSSDADDVGRKEQWRISRSRYAKISGFAAAASLAAVLLVAALLWLRSGEQYSTPVGGLASVRLLDGSNVTLNTASRIRVDLQPRERRVELEQGEAFFAVAKDPNRAFVVLAGDNRVVAVGTQFSVWRSGSDLRVVVTEGTVRLEPAAETDGATEGHTERQPGKNGSPLPLKAGSIARARDGNLLVQTATLIQAQEMLSWRDGYLTFHETTLENAVTEFNRYNTHQLMIRDAELAAIRINGRFRPTNYAAFVRLLHEAYAIQANNTGDSTVLTQY